MHMIIYLYLEINNMCNKCSIQKKNNGLWHEIEASRYALGVALYRIAKI